jgi:nicotinate-nucleotide pyrophosphorylase (carboxylating)
MSERIALNLAMRLSDIATATNKYVECIADLSTQLVDTHKTISNSYYGNGSQIFEDQNG